MIFKRMLMLFLILSVIMGGVLIKDFLRDGILRLYPQIKTLHMHLFQVLLWIKMEKSNHLFKYLMERN